MNNVMTINGYQAVILYDSDIEMFRGEFLGLNGGADFYAKDIEGLHREGEISLKVFLDACAADFVTPRQPPKMVRISHHPNQTLNTQDSAL